MVKKTTSEPTPLMPFMVEDWYVEPASGMLTKQGQEQRLEPKAMAVLTYLAMHAGQAVTRMQLEDHVWAGTVVSYDSLTGTIKKIRDALGDDPRKPHVIETLSKRGYRLIAPVNWACTSSNKMAQAPRHKYSDASPVIIVSICVMMLVAGLVSLTKQDLSPRDAVAAKSTVASARQELSYADKPSIAVLPFANISRDREQDYFANGMTEYLITDLSRLPQLLVISRASIAGYDSKSADIPAIAGDLNVRYVLTGSVHRNGDRIRVATQLSDASNNVQVWGERFDLHINQVFDVQDKIIKKIIDSLIVQVSNSEQSIRARSYTTNLEAHDYYMRGRAMYTAITKDGNNLARRMYRRATEIDPGFASAYGALAVTYVDDYRRKWGDDPGGAVQRAVALADKAVSLDENAAVGHWVRAYVTLYGKKDPQQAIKSAERAILLFPSYAEAYAILASAHSFIGRSEEAVRYNLQAMRLNPHASFVYYANLGRDYYFLGQHQDAIKSLETAIFRNENYLNAHLYLAANLIRLGKIDAAAWEVERVEILDPEFSLRYWEQTQPYQQAQRRKQIVADMRKAGFPL